MSIISAQNAPESADPACLDTPVDAFFQADHEPVRTWLPRERAALAICASCPIREACLEDALRFPAAEQHGVRGGATEGQRRALIRNRRQAARRQERAA